MNNQQSTMDLIENDIKKNNRQLINLLTKCLELESERTAEIYDNLTEEDRTKLYIKYLSKYEVRFDDNFGDRKKYIVIQQITEDRRKRLTAMYDLIETLESL